MKNPLNKYALILPALFFNFAFAQSRGGGSRGGGGSGGSYNSSGGGGGPQARGGGSVAPSRSYNNGGPSSFRSPSTSQSTPGFSPAQSTQRYAPTQSAQRYSPVNKSSSASYGSGYSRGNYSPSSRVYTNRSYTGNRASNSTSVGVYGSGSFRTQQTYVPIGRGGGGRYYGSPRYTSGVPYYGQRFSTLNHSYLSIGFGGYDYGYYNGIFYRPYGGYYEVAYPPYGITIGSLPYGYNSFYYGGNPYYSYNGVFYDQNENNQYKVVKPPLGAKLPELPAGAKPVVINGDDYYELSGTYYAATYNSNNQVLYEVVGVDGVLDNSKVAEVTPPAQPQQVQPTPQTYESQSAIQPPANIVNSLPVNCKHVTLNGQQYYISTDNVYYQEIVNNNGTISYKVVGNVENDN